jgi:hypothetical protein
MGKSYFDFVFPTGSKKKRFFVWRRGVYWWLGEGGWAPRSKKINK